MSGTRAARHLLRWSLPAGLAIGLLAGLLAVHALERAPRSVTGGLRVGRPGPWGTIERLPFTFEPDLHAVSPADCPETPRPWAFPRTDLAGVRQRLRALDVPAALVGPLVDATTCDASGCTVRPEVLQVLALSSRVRAGLHRDLVRNGGNPWARSVPVRTRQAFEASLAASGLPAKVQEEIAALWIPWGEVLALPDPAPVCRGLSDDARRRVARFVAGTDTFLARVLVPVDADLERMTAFWQGARRFTGVRSLFASLAVPPCGGRLDVAHVLPAFARKRVGRLPQSDEAGGDALWFALNFFEAAPRKEWMSPGQADEVLGLRWREIPVDSATLGDLLRFSVDDVAAVGLVVAGDLLITRFGGERFDPWVLSERRSILRELEPLGTVTVQAFRRRAY